MRIIFFNRIIWDINHVIQCLSPSVKNVIYAFVNLYWETNENIFPKQIYPQNTLFIYPLRIFIHEQMMGNVVWGGKILVPSISNWKGMVFEGHKQVNWGSGPRSAKGIAREESRWRIRNEKKWRNGTKRWMDEKILSAYKPKYVQKILYVKH